MNNQNTAGMDTDIQQSALGDLINRMHHVIDVNTAHIARLSDIRVTALGHGLETADGSAPDVPQDEGNVGTLSGLLNVVEAQQDRIAGTLDTLELL